MAAAACHKLLLDSMKFSSILSGNSGFTLVEANVAAAISIMSLCGTFAASANILTVLRSANQSVTASQGIQERVEEIRIANWVQVTDVDYLKNSLLKSPTNSARRLPECVETLTVTAYPAPSSGTNTPLKLIRSDMGVTVESTNPGLKDGSMIKVEWALNWRGPSANPSRRTAVLVAKGGIVK